MYLVLSLRTSIYSIVSLFYLKSCRVGEVFSEVSKLFAPPLGFEVWSLPSKMFEVEYLCVLALRPPLFIVYGCLSLFNVRLMLA